MDIPIRRLETVDSTNLFVKQAILENRLSGPGIVVGRIQKNGMGAKGAVWHSDNALGLWATLYFSPCDKPVFPLIMAVSTAVVRALFGRGVRAGIKWPNDVCVGRKKICGILAETIRGSVLAGLGVNLNQTLLDFPLDLRQTATSFLMEKGEIFPVDDFLLRFLTEFKSLYQEQNLLAEYQERLIVLHEPMLMDGEKVVVQAVGSDGGLVLAHEDGTVKTHFSGKLTWRDA